MFNDNKYGKICITYIKRKNDLGVLFERKLRLAQEGDFEDLSIGMESLVKQEMTRVVNFNDTSPVTEEKYWKEVIFK